MIGEIGAMLDPALSPALTALIDRIIPADDFPSASQAGVGEFLQRMFRGDLQSWSVNFSAAIVAVGEEAMISFGRPFEQLDIAQQDQLLTQIEAGKCAAAWPMEPAYFFRRLVALVAEGYYSDPANGGNRDEIAWKMIGYDPGANRPELIRIGDGARHE